MTTIDQCAERSFSICHRNYNERQIGLRAKVNAAVTVTIAGVDGNYPSRKTGAVKVILTTIKVMSSVVQMSKQQQQQQQQLRQQGWNCSARSGFVPKHVAANRIRKLNKKILTECKRKLISIVMPRCRCRHCQSAKLSSCRGRHARHASPVDLKYAWRQLDHTTNIH